MKGSMYSGFWLKNNSRLKSNMSFISVYMNVDILGPNWFDQTDCHLNTQK